MPVTEATAQRIYDELYEEHDVEAPPITCWVALATGMMPLRIDCGMVMVPWEVALEHGRAYIREIQSLTWAKEGREKRIAEEVKLVGGSFPW